MMMRALGLWLAGLEEVPDNDARYGLQGYLATVHSTVSGLQEVDGDAFRTVGRIRGEGADDIREIIQDKNEWLLVRRRR